MNKLKYLPDLNSVMWSHIDDLVSPVAKAFLCIQDGHAYLNECPHAIISGKSCIVRRTIARKHVLRLFDKQNLGQPTECENYTSYPEFIEINVDQLENKMTLHEIVKDIARHNDISALTKRRRRIIMVHNFDSLSITTMHAMRKVIESFYETTYFLLTCRTTSRIVDAILSRCIIINTNIDIKKATCMLLNECKRNDLSPHIDDILEIAEYDILNVCYLLELKCPFEHKSALKDFTKNALLRAKSCKGTDLEILIRDVCTKISAACIPVHVFARLIIEYVNEHAPFYILQVVKLAAELEHSSMISNKSLFATEQFLYEIASLLQNTEK